MTLPTSIFISVRYQLYGRSRDPDVCEDMAYIKAWLSVLGSLRHSVLTNSFIVLKWYDEIWSKLAHTISIARMLLTSYHNIDHVAF